jgi:hypothetical protein
MTVKLCAMLVVAMSVIGRPAAAAGGSQEPALDICALLPSDEAMKIVGGQGAGRARSVKRSDAGMECRYNLGISTFTIMVNGGTSKAKWDDFMKELKSAGASMEAVSGVGDGAYFFDDHRLYAHSGNYELTVSTTPSPGDMPEKLRADKVALAKAVVAKLKS